MSSLRAVRRLEEPVRAPTAELRFSRSHRLVVRLGRVRVPLALGLAPWATAYRLPSGRVVWCLRLRQDSEVLRRVVTTPTLRRYASASGLPDLLASVDRVLAGAD